TNAQPTRVAAIRNYFLERDPGAVRPVGLVNGVHGDDPCHSRRWLPSGILILSVVPTPAAACAGRACVGDYRRPDHELSQL
ncbi:MAG: hypothetical protein ACREDI_15445, partial [Roseiarcus sp.]